MRHSGRTLDYESAIPGEMNTVMTERGRYVMYQCTDFLLSQSRHLTRHGSFSPQIKMRVYEYPYDTADISCRKMQASATNQVKVRQGQMYSVVVLKRSSSCMIGVRWESTSASGVIKSYKPLSLSNLSHFIASSRGEPAHSEANSLPHLLFLPHVLTNFLLPLTGLSPEKLQFRWRQLLVREKSIL